MYSVPEQVAYSGVQGVSFSGLLCSYAVDLFILKVRLCKGFSLTPALRTKPFLFRIFFFQCRNQRCTEPIMYAYVPREMEFNNVQSFPCSHSKSSFESQFLESQNLFLALKLYYTWFPDQRRKTNFIIECSSFHSNTISDTIKQYFLYFMGNFYLETYKFILPIQAVGQREMNLTFT